jgi:hypothetical protein
MARTAHYFTSPYLLQPTRSLGEACWAYHRARGVAPPCTTQDSAGPYEASETGATSETATFKQCVRVPSCPFQTVSFIDRKKTCRSDLATRIG